MILDRQENSILFPRKQNIEGVDTGGYMRYIEIDTASTGGWLRHPNIATNEGPRIR